MERRSDIERFSTAASGSQDAKRLRRCGIGERNDAVRGYPFEKRWGGRNLRDTFLHNPYYKGKKLGGGACVAAECLKAWRPFVAATDAVASGFWEPITRPDGTRQWAYKGYALYTYAGDKVPGDHSGQATYAFEKVEGSSSDLKQAFFILDISKATGAAAIYWNIAKP